MRKFTATLVPTQAGRLEIPAISMSSFDPKSRRYQSTATSPLSLEVAAAAAPASQAEAGLRPQRGDVSGAPVDLLNSRIFWGVQAIPLLLLLAAWLAARPPRQPRPARVEPGGDFLSLVQATLSQKLGEPAGFPGRSRTSPFRHGRPTSGARCPGSAARPGPATFL